MVIYFLFNIVYFFMDIFNKMGEMFSGKVLTPLSLAKMIKDIKWKDE